MGKGLNDRMRRRRGMAKEDGLVGRMWNPPNKAVRILLVLCTTDCMFSAMEWSEMLGEGSR